LGAQPCDERIGRMRAALATIERLRDEELANKAPGLF
jgi:hypothetical protein